MRPVSLTSQLGEIRSLLRAMSDRVYAAMGVIRAHLESPDKDELMKVILLDNEVDKLEKTIDERILYIFATQQPLGQELREAYASVKIAHQIERIGDAVESLARQLASGEAQSIDRNRLINRMLSASMTLFLSSYRAMFEGDFAPVVDIYVKDDEVDRLHKNVYAEAKAILRKPATDTEVDTALQLINIGNKLEKIADISCNWAEQIDFALHGMNRRQITKRPQRLVILDSHGGVLAALVASYLNQFLGILEPSSGWQRGLELTLASLAPATGIVSVSRPAMQVLARKGVVTEALPVLRLDGVNWERTLAAVFIGSDPHLREAAQKQTRHKVVDLTWPEITPSRELINFMADQRKSSDTASVESEDRHRTDLPGEGAHAELDPQLHRDMERLLELLAERASGLATLLGRIQKAE